MNSKDLFIKFYQAETEKEVTKLIELLNMNEEQDWKPYGENESNFSVIGNQASNAERALIEKFTNSVDAVLMRKCYEKGIDPKGKDAPSSSRQALEVFFGIKEGETSNIEKEQERELSQNILLMATSKDCKPTEKQSRNNPNLIIFDRGEGQEPSRLEDTILSLLKGNKSAIPFTQGNYNQGGSGALMYCGENGYCLVISKRNGYIPKEQATDIKTVDKWGWTLIRKEIRENAKDPVYTYYAPNGKILMIEEETLPLLPKELSNKDSKTYLQYEGSCKGFIPYEEQVQSGTAIKLYNYKLAKKGPLNGNVKYDLAAYINDTYLPIRFIDCRKNKGSNSLYFRGFKKVIQADLRNNEEEEKGLVHSKFNFDFKAEDQQVVVTVYCCNKKASSDLNAGKLMEGAKPVKFCLGQQFQGGLTGRFLNGAGLGAIQDLIIMIIEFPNISTRFRSDLFATDRERLYDKKPKKIIEQKLKDFISKSEELREFRKYILKADATKPQDSEAIKEIMKEWVEKDPTISELLLGNNIFNNKVKKEEQEEGEEGEVSVPHPVQGGEPRKNSKRESIQTQYMPTYFKPMLRKNENDEYLKPTAINKSFRIRFVTDVEEDFFTRMNHQGQVTIVVDGKETSEFSKVIKNGKATFIFNDKLAGKKIMQKTLEFRITCKGGLTFEYTILLDVKDDLQGKIKDKGNNKNEIGLPNYREVTEENWLSGMKAESAVMLVNDLGTETYYINIDNTALKVKIDSLTDEVEKDLYKQMYTYMMLFMAIGMRHNNKKPKDVDQDEKAMSVEDEINVVTREYAKFMFVGEKLMDDLKKRLGKLI